MEQQILGAALHDRSAWEQLTANDILESLSDTGQIIWGLIDEYYKIDTGAETADRTILRGRITRDYPKHEELLSSVLMGLPTGSGPNLLHDIREQKLEAVRRALARKLDSGKEDEIEKLWQEYKLLERGGETEAGDDEVVIGPDVAGLLAKRSGKNRIKVLPEALNNNLEGGALRGHHIVLFAVTEMGKSLFALNMIRGFIEQDLKVLYAGNEDPLSDIIERFLMCVCNQTKSKIRSNPQKAQEVAEKKGWGNIVWAGLSPGNLSELQSLVEEHKPDVLIVDQIRNLELGEKNYVRTLEKAAQAMRNLAKGKNLLAVSITQAGDSANGKAVLGRGDIDSSNVGIPGTADLMLGIGATEEQEFDGIRTLSFPKNKISGNKRPIQVFFNEKTMRVE